MARFDILSPETGNVAGAAMNADLFLELGIRHSSGRAGPIDLVEAHKWFNIAASKGSSEAVRMRSELASEMSPMDIAMAQRAARSWLSVH